MSQFYGDIQGSAKTLATRRGHKSSGLTSHIRGWDGGVRVKCRWCEERKEDRFYVYATGGSNDPRTEAALITLDAQGNIVAIGDAVRLLAFASFKAREELGGQS